MALLINVNTGLAEDLPGQEADQALSAGSHEIPLNDEQGNLTTANPQMAAELMGRGHTQLSQDQLKLLLDHAKYQSTEEQLKAFAEGVAEGVAGPLAPAIETKVFGADPEEVRKRRELNPGVFGSGQAVGLGGSLLSGVGAGAVMGKAGAAAAKRLLPGAAMEGASALSRIGSAAVREATEMAILGASDEVSRMILKDPEQTVGSAMANIGLSGLFGAGGGAVFGSIGPMWEKANGPKLTQAIKSIVNRAESGGMKTLGGDSLEGLMQSAGVSLSPEMKSALSSNPELRSSFQKLMESNSKPGTEIQASLQAMKDDLQNAAVGALGKTAKEIEGLAAISEADRGKALQKVLAKELQDKFEPISKQFRDIQEKFSAAEVTNARKAAIADAINNMAQKNDYGVLKGGDDGKLIADVLGSLPDIDTAKRLTGLQSRVREQANKYQLWDLGKKINSILDDAHEQIMIKAVGDEAPALLGQFKAAKEAYKPARILIDELNDRLHVGPYGGPESFKFALSQMKPEDVLRRLTPKNDAGLLKILQDNFPSTSAATKEAFMAELAERAALKAKGSEVLSPSVLSRAMNEGWSNELKAYALPAGAAEKLKGIEALYEAIPNRMNTSGTAKTLDSLWAKLPAGLMSLAGAMVGGGHGALGGGLGAAVGWLLSGVLKDGPDAARLAMLKYMGGADGTIYGSGVKAASSLISTALKAEKAIDVGVKNVLKPGLQVLAESDRKGKPELEKVDKKLQSLAADNSPILNIGADTAHYMSEHASQLAQTAQRAVDYLSSLKPQLSRGAPLDPEPMPSKEAELKYLRQLQIAEQPLMILQHIKDGTLIPQDVQTIQILYPGFYKNVTTKLNRAMIDAVAAGEQLSYKLKMNLSLFMGEILDSTLKAESIMAAQPKAPPQLPMPTPLGGPMPKKPQDRMGKIGSMYETPGQSREATRLRM